MQRHSDGALAHAERACEVLVARGATVQSDDLFQDIEDGCLSLCNVDCLEPLHGAAQEVHPPLPAEEAVG
jgi:hypothetical protein